MEEQQLHVKHVLLLPMLLEPLQQMDSIWNISNCLARLAVKMYDLNQEFMCYIHLIKIFLNIWTKVGLISISKF